MQVRNKVSPDQRFAIGLRLGAEAAKELSDQTEITQFRRWLDQNDAYVFTINGFPYGNFHGSRVKEQVYRPDWTAFKELDYTLLLFSIMEQLLEPVKKEALVLFGSFKEFLPNQEIPQVMIKNLDTCALED